MAVMKCAKCRKSIEFRKECEEEGTAYHAKCFVCRVCHRFVSEYDVLLRDRKVFCKEHGKFLPGLQPMCKIYFNCSRTAYRVIYASDKAGGDDEEEEGE